MSVSGFKINGATQKYNYPDLDNISVQSGHIADGAVIIRTIADGAVTRGKIAEGAVNDFKIASNAVITRTIADGAVTRGKIASGVIPIYILNVETTSEEQSSKEIDRSLTISSGELRELLTGSRLAITFNTDETHSITLYEYSRTYASEAMIDAVELIAFGYSRNDTHVIAKAVAGIAINSSDEVAAEITLSWV